MEGSWRTGRNGLASPQTCRGSRLVHLWSHYQLEEGWSYMQVNTVIPLLHLPAIAAAVAAGMQIDCQKLFKGLWLKRWSKISGSSEIKANSCLLPCQCEVFPSDSSELVSTTLPHPQEVGSPLHTLGGVNDEMLGTKPEGVGKYNIWGWICPFPVLCGQDLHCE